MTIVYYICVYVMNLSHRELGCVWYNLSGITAPEYCTLSSRTMCTKSSNGSKHQSSFPINKIEAIAAFLGRLHLVASVPVSSGPSYRLLGKLLVFFGCLATASSSKQPSNSALLRSSLHSFRWSSETNSFAAALLCSFPLFSFLTPRRQSRNPGQFEYKARPGLTLVIMRHPNRPTTPPATPGSNGSWSTPGTTTVSVEHTYTIGSGHRGYVGCNTMGVGTPAGSLAMSSRSHFQPLTLTHRDYGTGTRLVLASSPTDGSIARRKSSCSPASLS